MDNNILLHCKRTLVLSVFVALFVARVFIIVTMFIMTCFSRLAFNHFHHKIGRMYLAASLELQPAAIGAGLGERGVYIQFAAFHRRVRVDKLL